MIDHPSVSENVELASMTTYKVGGPARFFAEPASLSDLRDLLSVVPEGTDVVVLGRGSNVVISDTGIDGLVIRLGSSFQAVDVAQDGRVTAGAGASLPKLARFAAKKGRSGLGFYVGIPGSVGGAVRMNAGGHGSETKEVLGHAVVLDVGRGEVTQRTANDLGLSYRHSDLTDDTIVVQATFLTEPGDSGQLEEELRSITRWRKDNQPGGTLNAGSVFKNPPGQHAGEIIDDLGLRGESIGPVQVSQVHANFMVAATDATADDIFRFVYKIRDIVGYSTDIELIPEIRFLGDFTNPGVPQ